MTSLKKILVIDDEPDIISYLSTFLEDEGFEVVTAQDGRKGLAAAQDQMPDLITLDITMPGMSGIEVLTALRRDPKLQAIPVIVITGVAKFQNATSFRDVRPPEVFIAKPMNLELLLTHIHDLINKNDQRSEEIDDVGR